MSNETGLLVIALAVGLLAIVHICTRPPEIPEEGEGEDAER